MTPEQERMLDRQGWLIRDIGKEIVELHKELRDVKDKQQKDHEAFTQYVAIATSAAQTAEKIAEKAVTTKQLYLSFTAAVIALGGFLVTFSQLVHG